MYMTILEKVADEAQYGNAWWPADAEERKAANFVAERGLITQVGGLTGGFELTQEGWGAMACKDAEEAAAFGHDGSTR